MSERPSHVERTPRGVPVLGHALLACAVLLGGLHCCRPKGASFFGPALGDESLLPDVDGPAFSNLLPQQGLGGPLHLDSFSFDVNDAPGSNGARPSGVNFASVRALRSGLNLPLTRSGSTWTGSLAGIADGPLSLQLSAQDSAGNQSSYDWSFLLKNTPPTITWSLQPQFTWQSNAPSVDFSFGGSIEDAHFRLATGAIYKAGADNTCGTADDALWPKGTAGGQVDENMFDYTSSVMLNHLFFGMYRAYNGVPVGGTATVGHYCIHVQASDSARNGTGGPNPNLSTSIIESNLTWQPPAPAVGSIVGHVRLGSGGVAGMTVQVGGMTTTTASDGSYSFQALTPGPWTVSISGIPAGITCTPTAKSTTVVAGQTSTVDFSCSMASTFSLLLSGDYLHHSGFSTVCLHAATNPPQANATYTATVTGPAGGVSGSGQHSGTTDASGNALVTNDIFLFGTYNWQMTIGSVSASTSINVAASAGTCVP